MSKNAPQRKYDLREVYIAFRWIVRTGSQRRMMSDDLPPWEAVYQQSQWWPNWGVFEMMVHDLRELIRISDKRNTKPSTAIYDSCTLHSTPESGHRPGI